MGGGGRRREALLVLCLIGFLENCKPSEPFLTVYLNKHKNITQTQMQDKLWPLNTYATLAALLPVGCAAELLSSKAVLLVGLLCRQATRILLLFGNGIAQMMLMQLAYSVAVASNSVFFAYVYAVVPTQLFTFATSVLFASYHFGNVVASLLGQLWVWHKTAADSAASTMDVFQPLFYFSWVTASAALLLYIFLPAPLPNHEAESLFSYVRTKGISKTVKFLLVRPFFPSEHLISVANDERAIICGDEDTMNGCDIVKGDSRPTCLHGSLCFACWWLCSQAATAIVLNYFQLQIFAIDSSAPVGLVETGMELALVLGGVLAATCRQTIRGRELVLLLVNALFASALYASCALAAMNSSLKLCIISNVLACVVYSFQSCIASAKLASTLPVRYDAAFFSLFQLLSLAVAALLQGVGSIMGMDANRYYFCISVLYIFPTVLCLVSFYRRRKQQVEE